MKLGRNDRYPTRYSPEPCGIVAGSGENAESDYQKITKLGEVDWALIGEHVLAARSGERVSASPLGMIEALRDRVTQANSILSEGRFDRYGAAESRSPHRCTADISPPGRRSPFSMLSLQLSLPHSFNRTFVHESYARHSRWHTERAVPAARGAGVDVGATTVAPQTSLAVYHDQAADAHTTDN